MTPLHGGTANGLKSMTDPITEACANLCQRRHQWTPEGHVPSAPEWKRRQRRTAGWSGCPLTSQQWRLYKIKYPKKSRDDVLLVFDHD